MKKTFTFKFCLRAVRSCLLMLCLLSFAHAETDTAQQIKLGFIYNFAKFVTWPNLSHPAAPFELCVIGTQPLSEKIALLQNKKVAARLIQVQFLTQDKQLSRCNMVFIAESEIPRLEKWLLAIAAFPILTVSTIPDFVQAGGMIGLKEFNGQLRFDVSLSATTKARLIVNSQLADLADEVLQ